MPFFPVIHVAPLQALAVIASLAGCAGARAEGPSAAPGRTASLSLRESEVARVVHLNFRNINACYDVLSQTSPNLTSNMKVVFAIDAAGAVSNATAQRSVYGGNPGAAEAALGECVAAVFRRMAFRAPGAPTGFEFHFYFSPSGADPALGLTTPLPARESTAPPQWPAEELPPPPSSAPHPVAELLVPGTVNGVLDATDLRLGDGSIYDDYRLSLQAGEPVTIAVRGGPTVVNPSVHLDMYLYILRGELEVTHDDDSAGDLNSGIIYTSLESGEYILRINTYGPNARRGTYTIETWRGAVTDAH